MRTFAAIDESLASLSRPFDVGGGNDVIDTDCFIGLVERVCLSVIEVSMFYLFCVCCCLTLVGLLFISWPA